MSAVMALAPAAFGRSKLQGVGQASLGYTDNVRSSPDEAVYDAEGEVLLPAKSPDAFGILSPGVVYGIEVPGALHRFSYAYSALLFLDNSSANTYSNRLEWRGFLEPSPRLELIASASATQSHHHATGTVLSASQTALNAAIPGTAAYVLATGDEGIVYGLSESWVLNQSLGGAIQAPVFDASGPKTYQLSARLGLEHIWQSDALGVDGRTRYVAYTGAPLALPGEGGDLGARGDQDQLINEAVLTWRHDYTYEFSSRAEAGVAEVLLLSRDRRFWQPVGLASVAYTREGGEAELSYRHALTSSVFLGLTFVTDEVRLHGSIPFGKQEQVYLSTSTGYQRSRILDINGELATRLNVGVVDVALSYRVRHELEITARYQHVEQVSGAELPPLPLSYVRNSAWLTATLEYPPDREMPREYRQPRRVDRNDALEETPTDAPESSPFGNPRH